MTTATPKDTITLISRMLADGVLTDKMHRQLHHRGRGVLRHHKYLLKTKTYKHNSRNIRFHQKLACLYAEFKDMQSRV